MSVEVTTTQQQNSGSANTPDSPELTPSAGSAGLQTQLGGAPTTVSGVENASGGMGELVMPEVDKRIFMFERDQNSLMQLMLMAKSVNVHSMEVKHYAIDQGTPIVTVASVNGNTITLVNADQKKVRAYDTLMVKGVKGYDFIGGTNVKSRRPLQLFVKSVNNDDTITCIATNGVKQAATDQYGSLPTATSPTASNTNIITAGTKLVRMANAMYETQKWVDPNTVIPSPDDLYLQKRGMTSIVSKYLADQNMEIPYDEAVKAEAQLREFKAAGNRTLLISQQNKMLVRSSMGDDQWDYTTNGVLVSDALGLKGNCHIWVDGDDDDDDTAPAADEFRLWSSDTAPTEADLEDGVIYVFAYGMNIKSGTATITVSAGDAFKYNATGENEKKWVRFYGPISAE